MSANGTESVSLSQLKNTIDKVVKYTDVLATNILFYASDSVRTGTNVGLDDHFDPRISSVDGDGEIPNEGLILDQSGSLYSYVYTNNQSRAVPEPLPTLYFASITKLTFKLDIPNLTVASDEDFKAFMGIA